jgi:hypothetical protein
MDLVNHQLHSITMAMWEMQDHLLNAGIWAVAGKMLMDMIHNGIANDMITMGIVALIISYVSDLISAFAFTSG